MTRQEAATFLGVTLGRIRRLQTLGVLKVERPAELGGMLAFKREDIERVAITHPTRGHGHKKPVDDGVMAARIFRYFEQDWDLVRIVRKTQVTPERVRELYSEWLNPDLAAGEVRRREKESLEAYTKRMETIRKGFSDIVGKLTGR